MGTFTPLAPAHGAGGVFCVEAIDRAREASAPPRGKHKPLRHTARNDSTDRRRRGHSGGGARLAHRQSPRCSQKNGDRPTKTRSFWAITPRFLRRGESAAAKGRKAARNHGYNHRKDKNINFSPPNHQQKHVFTPCSSGAIRAEIRTFRRLGKKQQAEYSFYFKTSRTENRKRIDNAQEDAPQIVHPHASIHSLCPLCQRLPAPTFKINALRFRFVGAISRFSCKSEDKTCYFHLRRPLIPF